MSLGLLGKKLGMTRCLNDNGEPVGVTALQAGPCVVIDLRTKATHGYEAVVVAFGAVKEQRVSKARRGVFQKKGLPVQATIREFRCTDAGQFTIGQRLTVDLFAAGDRVQVTSTSKGRGYQGVIKRCGKHGGPAAHGSHFHRTGGSIGMRTWPARTIKNMGMAGQMGNVQRTTRNLQVVAVDTATNVIMLRGAVPGWRNGLVRIENPAKDFEHRVAQHVKAATETTAQA